MFGVGSGSSFDKFRLASAFSVVFANAGDRFAPATQQDVTAAVQRIRQGIWGWQAEVRSGDQGRPGESTDDCKSARESTAGPQTFASPEP